MLEANVTTLYVDDLKTSIGFYQQILGREAITFMPGLAMVLQESGARICLWERSIVKPAPTPSGGFELAFSVSEKSDVDEIHRTWCELGVTIVEPPHHIATMRTYTMLACDPDGHRLRVYRALTD